ncbi:hypothetical protein HYO65_gp077 [Tenacibaculum phage PTm1]|uniref:Uncharacterized protein n=2 Tax=Shirahamavirus PTm1 TaxID=2846435 RepID=A0A5S9BZ08_9CAUD|nr:hypothetical protein HYO65_gp077 [Tenacibaculum phage PTm1]BBI90469.1 hypothetical protein [Tenacibaculum phage PTm1]BBI90776.1 hypothetical protein [Tenacibaculum phage PTm5]
MARRKWIGTITRDLRSAGNAISDLPPEFIKGQTVTVWKKRRYETDIHDKLSWTGGYEYHYSDENGKGLVRTRDFLLEEFDEPNLR